MASVLAQQLSRLAAAQDPQAPYVRGKHSLLFDYQKAADVGAETLYNIALEGKADTLVQRICLNMCISILMAVYKRRPQCTMPPGSKVQALRGEPVQQIGRIFQP
jgi:hypothetical protein